MALALLCLTMFVLLTTASMRALRDEARRPIGAAAEHAKRADMAKGAQR